MYRLLVIDDEATFRTAVVHQLEDLGHTVEVAPDVEAGVDSFADRLEANQPFDGVLTDMLMPRSEGFPADGEAGLMVVKSPPERLKSESMKPNPVTGSLL
jgi:CheY-like chemotaxis protein